MPATPKDAGPTARRVALNVRARRQALRLELKDVSARLTTLGQPIAVSQLSALELGNRRVDVDDLVALALALDVNPSRLLLPPEADDSEVDLTPTKKATAGAAWAWAAGEAPLPAQPLDLDAMEPFRRACAPHVEHDEAPTLGEFEERADVLEPLAAAALRANGAGVRWPAIHGYLRVRRTMHDVTEGVRRGQR